MQSTRSPSMGNTISYIDPNDRVVNGLRIPANLDTVGSVNFVLTQEPGKLKPKDLKAAIERNRAERERRAEEQQKLREEGGGAGTLDLRGILAEEKLNAKDDDPFQRQLREMAFLADVEEVERTENEKAFRVSEDYLGANLLSDDDVDFVYRQRELTRIMQMKSRWRHRLSRQKTVAFAPSHPTVKAGVLQQTAQTMMQTLQPQYDPNKNDIWQKRLNTLRRFVYLVSTWLVRRRLERRMSKLMKYFHDHQAFTREQVRAFIEKESANHRSSGPNLSPEEKAEQEKKAAALAALLAARDQSDTNETKKQPLTATEMIFTKPNLTLMRILRNHKLLQDESMRVKEGHAEFTVRMAARYLTPSFDRNVLQDDRSAEQRGLLTVQQCLKETFRFDDRTYFHQKVEPDYLYRGYAEHSLRSMPPLHFPAHQEKLLRTGAPEERALREAADQTLRLVAQRQNFYLKHAAEPAGVVESMLEEVTKAGLPEDENNLIPAWMVRSSQQQVVGATEVSWRDTADIDFLTPPPQYRAYARPLPRCETDAYYAFRPNAPPIDMERDRSLRHRWQEEGAGYLGSHYYLLGQAESRWRDGAIPPLGPVLLDYYQADHDRHVSGLNCFQRDHLRDVNEWDPDIAPLQQSQDKRDVLTDSESDQEDDYYAAALRPSLEKVRQILHPPRPAVVEETASAGKGKGGKAAPAAAAAAPAAPAPAPVAAEDDQHSMFEGFEGITKNEAQVELMRDRKTLDLESTWWRARKQTLDAAYRRELEISQASNTVFGALRVQLPFHVYESTVYKHLTDQKRVPEVSNVFVEPDPHRTLHGSATSLSLQSPNMSPVKTSK